MKRINNEEILDRIYDLADARGIRIDDFISELEDEYGEKLPPLEGLPEEIVQELATARDTKKEMRKQDRIKKSQAEMAEEIKKFREFFPDVTAEDIPDEVWDEVSHGVGLSHAYALYSINEDKINRRAEDINGRNAAIGASARSDGSVEPVFTKELVEKMSGKDIKNNYKGILNAMKNWRF